MVRVVVSRPQLQASMKCQVDDHFDRSHFDACIGINVAARFVRPHQEGWITVCVYSSNGVCWVTAQQPKRGLMLAIGPSTATESEGWPLKQHALRSSKFRQKMSVVGSRQGWSQLAKGQQLARLTEAEQLAQQDRNEGSARLGGYRAPQKLQVNVTPRSTDTIKLSDVTTIGAMRLGKGKANHRGQ